MSRSVGAWYGSFDSGKRRTDAGSRSRLLTPGSYSFLYPSCCYRMIITLYFGTVERKAQATKKIRTRRARTDIREALLESALVEFGAKGFDGASTRAIAQRVEAHQPQINYHFESKTALWTAAVDYLFGLLGKALDGVLPAELSGVEPSPLGSAFAEGIRRFVEFAAAHPELNQIMVHEGTADSARLEWMTETHVKPVFDASGPLGRFSVPPELLLLSRARSSTTCSSAPHRCPMSMPPKSAFSRAGTRVAPSGSARTLTGWSPSSCQDWPPGRRIDRRPYVIGDATQKEESMAETEGVRSFPQGGDAGLNPVGRQRHAGRKTVRWSEA
jgi:AcrR family transcriptional regulator